MYEWSHEAAIDTINSGDSINYLIEVDSSTPDPLNPLTPIVTPITNLQFESIGDELPDTVTITNNSNSILIEGTVDASAIFESIAYSVNGNSIPVDTIDELPEGAEVHNMVPENTRYKYYIWRVYADDNGTLVERTFTLTVIVSWNAARAMIIQKVGEIVQ